MTHPALGFPVSRSNAGIHTGLKTLLPSASSLQACVPVTDRLPGRRSADRASEVQHPTAVATILAMTTLPLATVRDRLSSLVDDVTRTHDALTITRNGTPAVVVLSIDDYESIMETLALLNDPVDQERLAEAEQSVSKGDVISGEDMSRFMTQRPTGAA